DLALEPVHVHRGRHLGREDLDDHLPADPHLLGEEDVAHPAAAELALDAVLVAEVALEALGQLRHGLGSPVSCARRPRTSRTTGWRSVSASRQRSRNWV